MERKFSGHVVNHFERFFYLEGVGPKIRFKVPHLQS